MSISFQQAESLAREAVVALQRGDAATACERLAPLAAGGAFNPPWFLIAQARQAAGDDAGAAAALITLFEREPRHLAALLMMGAIEARRHDDRAAQTFYRGALAVASQPGAQVPPALVPALREAEGFITAASQRFTDHLEEAIAGDGFGGGGGRLRHAVDMLMGRRELHLQQPSMFYFPELAQRAFFDADEFDWLEPITAGVPAIREELLSAMAEGDGFSPYVVATAGRPPPANPLLNDSSWSAFYLWQSGAPVAAHAAQCPATMAALAQAPMPVITGRSPIALFSSLTPGTHIRPHHGLLNTRLIVHLPLIVPDGCALRVGAETRSWREGEPLVFDDSFEHEAWNRGNATRVVLLFEVWRPELSSDERQALTRIFEAIDTYQGPARDSG